MTTLGTMKVLGIQDKEGYSLVTFEVPDDCKQFLLEFAIRELLTKATKEAEEKYGSVLPEGVDQAIPTTLGLDNQTSQVYNEDKVDDVGWIPNTGVQPVEDDVRVDTKWGDDSLYLNDRSNDWCWDDPNITHWRLSKQV